MLLIYRREAQGLSCL